MNSILSNLLDSSTQLKTPMNHVRKTLPQKNTFTLHRLRLDTCQAAPSASFHEVQLVRGKEHIAAKTLLRIRFWIHIVRLCICQTSLSYGAVVVFKCGMGSFSPRASFWR